MREAGSGIDEAVSLSFEKARQVPAEMREEISARGGRQALPERYEDIVGAYYRALGSSTE